MSISGRSRKDKDSSKSCLLAASPQRDLLEEDLKEEKRIEEKSWEKGKLVGGENEREPLDSLQKRRGKREGGSMSPLALDEEAGASTEARVEKAQCRRQGKW